MTAIPRGPPGWAGADFSVDVTINRDHGITTVYAGELFAVHRAACQAAKRDGDAADRQAVRRRGDDQQRVPARPEPLPGGEGDVGRRPGGQGRRRDNLRGRVQRRAFPEHGEYKRLLTMRESPRELLEMVNEPGFSRHDQWQIQLQAQIQLRARVLLKSGYLTDDQVRAAHLEPVDDVEKAAADCLATYGPDAEVCVLPEGPQTIPYVE